MYVWIYVCVHTCVYICVSMYGCRCLHLDLRCSHICMHINVIVHIFMFAGIMIEIFVGMGRIPLSPRHLPLGCIFPNTLTYSEFFPHCFPPQHILLSTMLCNSLILLAGCTLGGKKVPWSFLSETRSLKFTFNQYLWVLKGDAYLHPDLELLNVYSLLTAITPMILDVLGIFYKCITSVWALAETLLPIIYIPR